MTFLTAVVQPILLVNVQLMTFLCGFNNASISLLNLTCQALGWIIPLKKLFVFCLHILRNFGTELVQIRSTSLFQKRNANFFQCPIMSYNGCFWSILVILHIFSQYLKQTNNNSEHCFDHQYLMLFLIFVQIISNYLF